MNAVIICGSRDWRDEHKIQDAIEQLPDECVVISGGAPGADTIAATLADRDGLPTEVFPADWNRHGKAAGPIRNGEMLRRLLEFPEPRLVIAFRSRPDSRGTNNMIDQARRAGVAVTIVDGAR